MAESAVTEAKEGLMPRLRKRPLRIAAMVGDAGPGVSAQSAAPAPVADATSEENRVDALTKLKALFDACVLTEEQYESERARLTAGI
jgi:hypothetical protein